MKTKKKKIENLKNVIDFNLVRKEPNSLELRAYLFQILNDCYGLSVRLKEYFKEEFSLLDDNVSEWDLNTISENDIRRILNEDRLIPLLPDEIFYFKNKYNPDAIADKNYKAFPQIFTRVCNVSFDCGGLIVLEHYKVQIYSLYDANGNCVIGSCNDLDLGTDGRILFRSSDSCMWEMMQYNGESFNDIEFFDPFDSPSDFPNISGRDVIPEMLPVGSFQYRKYDQSKVMSNEEIKAELENQSDSYHYLQKYYSDNEELAITAVNSNRYAFTFLSERLQNDKDFVIKLISSKKVNQWLYCFLNDQMKADIGIVKLCIKSDSRIIKKIAPVSDRGLMEEALIDHVFNLEYASDDLKADKNLVLSLVKREWCVLREVSKSLLSDSAFISEAISRYNDNNDDDTFLEEGPDSLPFDNIYKEKIDINKVVNYLVSFYPRVLKHIAPASDMKIICKCLAYTYEEDMPFIIDCISEDLKKTKEFWETAIQKSLFMLKNAPLIYRQDKEVVLSAIRYHGELVEFADERLKDDPEIYLASIRQIRNRRGTCDPGQIIHLIPEKFKSDMEFLLKALDDYPRIFEHVPMDLISDREFMLEVIKRTYGWIIQYAAPELKSDRQFIVAAAKLNKDILRWLPKNFKDDKELIELLRKERIESDITFSEDDPFF
jgi:hypothetical protein